MRLQNLCQLFFLSLFFAFPAALMCQAQDTDFQIWNETTFIKPIIKTKDAKGKEITRLSLLFFGNLRLGQNRAFLVDKRIGTGLDIRLNNNFSFSPTYLYRGAEPVRNRKEYEHRIRFDLTYERKWSKFSFKNRNRVEYRARNSRSDSVRYRNKSTFKFSVKNSNGDVLFEPFIADEPYYDIKDKVFSSNEFSAGIGRKLSKSVSAEFFYVRRDNRSGTPRHINGVGANFKIILP